MERSRALALMHEHTESEALRKHMYAVELTMRAYARHYGEDEETWGITGLLHDFDYEKHPNGDHSPTEGHPSFGVSLLREEGVDEDILKAILGHATYTGVTRESLMAKVLFAVDELCGFLVACTLVRPSRSLKDLKQDFLPTYLYLAVIYEQMEQPEEARQALTYALSLQPALSGKLTLDAFPYKSQKARIDLLSSLQRIATDR